MGIKDPILLFLWEFCILNYFYFTHMSSFHQKWY